MVLTINNITLFWISFWLYLASTVSYSIYVGTQGKIKWANIGKKILITAFVVQVAGFIWRWIVSKHLPLSNLFEFQIALILVLVAFYLILEKRLKLTPVVGLVAAGMSFIIIAVASLLPKEESAILIPALQSYWLNIHVSLAIIGDGAFFVGFAGALCYLIKKVHSENIDTKEKAKSKKALSYAIWILSIIIGGIFMAILLKKDIINPAGGWGIKGIIYLSGSVLIGWPFTYFFNKIFKPVSKLLPSVEVLDEASYKAIAIGFPLYTFGALVAGSVWAHEAWGSYWSNDPKEWSAALVWFVYLVYLHGRYSRGWKGNRTAILAVTGFILVFLATVSNLILGGLHSYSGVE